ncbi:30S ribosomal protein S20 [Candidatus Shapirobacteria bacterium]|nr:30S ribosomal protein S20 [Candidatus Shapirobacteria bacterium]
MPIGRSAKKSLRKAVKNHKTNVFFKNKLKLVIKEYLVKPTEKGLVEVASFVDKAVKKSLMHINKAARIKSRLSKMLSAPKAEVKTKAVVKKVVKKVPTKRTAKEKMSK